MLLFEFKVPIFDSNIEVGFVFYNMLDNIDPVS